VTVHFENVGRDKRSWSATISHVSHEVLARQVRPHLMSCTIEFMIDEDGSGGDVIVGGWRPVGRFRIEGGVSLGEVRL